MVENERIDAQGSNRRVRFSNILNGSYKAKIIGGCLERAVMESYVLSRLGYDAALRMGEVAYGDPDNPDYDGHAWNKVSVNGRDYISDVSSSTFAKVDPLSEISSKHYKNQVFAVR